MQIDLSGRSAIVTGSTRGIGRAIAQQLSDSGANVAIVGRDPSTADMVASTMKSARGFGCDITDSAAVAALVEDVEKAFGGVDLLVNHAGITRDNLLMRLKDDDWDAVLAANLKAAFVATRAVSRGMMKKRWGRIINIASVVGLVGNKGQSNYAASKAGSDDAQRIEVASAVDVAFPHRLFRGHVRRSPDGHPGCGQSRIGTLSHGARDAEVRHHDATVIIRAEEDVVRLDTTAPTCNRCSTRRCR